MSNFVSLQYLENYNMQEVSNSLAKALEETNLFDLTSIKEKTIALLVDIKSSTLPNEAKSTHPTIVKAVAEKLAKLGAKVVIFSCPDSNFTFANLNKIYENTGMLDASNDGYAELNYDLSISNIKFDGCKAKDFYLSNIIYSADYIVNIGKFYANEFKEINGCVSNLFNLVPGEYKKTILNRCSTINSFEEYLLDIYNIVKDKILFNILDAVVSCEDNGNQYITNSLLLGKNPIAVDLCAYSIINKAKENVCLYNLALTKNLIDSQGFEIDENIKMKYIVRPNFSCKDFNAEDNINGLSTKAQTLCYNSTVSRPKIDKKHCKGCLVCVKNCPANAIIPTYNEFNEATANINLSKCLCCMKCVASCPYKMIKKVVPQKCKSIQNKLNKKMETKNK